MKGQKFATESAASQREASHVPMNEFNLRDLVRNGDSHHISTTRPSEHSSSQDGRTSVAMPMADGTSLLHVIDAEITRVRDGQTATTAVAAKKGMEKCAEGSTAPEESGTGNVERDEAAGGLKRGMSFEEKPSAITRLHEEVKLEPLGVVEEKDRSLRPKGSSNEVRSESASVESGLIASKAVGARKSKKKHAETSRRSKKSVAGDTVYDQPTVAQGESNTVEKTPVLDTNGPKKADIDQNQSSSEEGKALKLLPSSSATKTEQAAYWVERPYDPAPNRLMILKAKDKSSESAAAPASIVVAPSEQMADPKVELIVRLYKVPDRHNQEFSSDKHVSLNTSMQTVHLHLREECRLIADNHRLRMSIIGIAHQCFHFRACPDLTTEPSHNFYITNNDKSDCRFKQVRDVFHTHQIEAAARDGTALSLRFMIEMVEAYLPVAGETAPIRTYEDDRPEFGLWGARMTQDKKATHMSLMTSEVLDIGERKWFEIYKDLTIPSASPDLNEDKQNDMLARVVSQIPDRKDKLRTPSMTFSRYERSPTLAPTTPPTELYLIIRLFTHLNTIGFPGFDPPAAILLKIPADRTADKIKRALIHEMKEYVYGRTDPQPRSSYRSAFRELLRDDVKQKWTLQLWAMPQEGQRKRLHICRKKEDFRGLLVEGKGNEIYMEAHFVPSKETVFGWFGKEGGDGDE